MAGVEGNNRDRAGWSADAAVSATTAATRVAVLQIARKMRRRGEESRCWWLVPTIYIIFLMLPIYWLINMSFKTNQEILSSLLALAARIRPLPTIGSSSPTRPGIRATSTRSPMWL